MQEIKYDGSRGEKKEGTIDDLLEMTKESLDKEDVAGVLIFKGESLDVDMSPEIEERLREIVREELKIILERRDPFFRKILKEIQDD